MIANDYGKRGDEMIKEVQKNHPSLKEVELHGEKIKEQHHFQSFF